MAIEDKQTDSGTQQVPTGSGSDVNVPPEAIRALQSRMGGQEKLQMPNVDPKAGKIGMGTAILGGALNMFVPFLGTAVMQHSKRQKEQQVNEALNEFQVLDGIWDAAWQRAAIEAKGDQEKTKQLAQQYASQDPRMEALFGGPAGKKRIKNFAKVFQQPWINDGKTTAHTEALKKFMQLKPMSKMMEGLAQSILGRQGGQGKQAPPQGQPQQPQQGQPQQGQQGQQPGADLFSGLPHKVIPPDEKALTPYSEYLRALESWHKRWDMKFGTDGKPFAFDAKTGEAKEVMVQKADGSDEKYSPTMMVRGRTGIATVDGVPMGVFGMTDSGQWGVKTPDMKSWNGSDAKQFEAAKAAWAMSQKKKDDRVVLSAKWRANAYAALRPYSVYDTETGNMVMVPADQIAANRDRYVGGPQAMQLTNRQNLFNEIAGTERELRRTIDNMGETTFDEKTRAQIAAVLKADSPTSALDGFLKSNIADTLSDAQVEYVTALASMEESALSLRTLGGMGQGSDMMRAAILRMVPGAGTPSGKYATRQLDLLDIELRGLKKSMPGLGNEKKDKKQTLQEYLDERKKRSGGQKTDNQ